jgi:uncharacterized protein
MPAPLHPPSSRRFRSTSTSTHTRSIRGLSYSNLLGGERRAQTLLGDLYDGKRDTYRALGYPRKITLDNYRTRRRRGGIAKRICNLIPESTWRNGLDVYEDPDPEILTPFEEDFLSLTYRLDLWTELCRADKIRGLCRYSVLLIGAPEDLSTPLSLSGPDSILYLKSLAEDRAEIERKDLDTSSPRFGLPLSYRLSLGDTNIELTRSCHWTRVVHIAYPTLESRLYGEPDLEAVWNYLCDLDKLVGGGSEAAWRRMDPGKHVDIDKDMKPGEGGWEEVFDAIEEQLEDYEHGLRRDLTTRGVKVTPLSASVAGFGGNADSVKELIAATIGVATRILYGSERGELASGQDRDEFSNLITERVKGLGVPLVRDLTQRLVDYGGLASPLNGVFVVEPITTTETLSLTDTVAVISTLSSANSVQVGFGDQPIATSQEMRDVWLGWQPLEQSQLDDIGEEEGEGEGDEEVEGDGGESSGERAAKERAAKDRPTSASRSLAASPLPDSPLHLLRRVADSHLHPLSLTWSSAWSAARDSIDDSSLELALSFNPSIAEVILLGLVDSTETTLRPLLSAQLQSTLTSAAESTLKAAQKRGSFRTAAQFTTAAVDPSISLLSMAFDHANPSVIQWALARSSALITETSLSTKQAVREVISDAAKSGLAPRLQVPRIKEVVGLRSDQYRALGNYRSRLESRLPPLSTSKIDLACERYARKLHKQRALLIARTETMRSANQGQMELWKQAVDKGLLANDDTRKWLATPDDRLRDSHADLQGQETTIDGTFVKVDGTSIEPGEEPNCRCASGLVDGGGA